MYKMNMRKTFTLITILFLILFLSNTCLAAISVQEIINNMQKAYDKQMDGINDYSIIQKPAGGIASFAGEIKMFYKKARIDGEEIFKSRSETEVMGMDFVTIYDGKYNWSTNPMTGEVEKELAQANPVQFWKNMNPSNTSYSGEDTIDGKKVYLLQIENALQVMGGLQAQASSIQDDGLQIATGTLWVNSKTWMPLRMQMVMKTGSQDEDITMNLISTTDFKDYRQVGSMLHPFQLVINTKTEIDTSEMSEEEKEEQKQAMMMMQSMMSGMGSFTVDTLDLSINTGLSDNLFDGTKLE
jgi:outer membrane lipoprotein-sorting protein